MNEKEFDYINVIPLVDVMLVLLTIVLTTSAFIATGAVPIELPKAAKSPAETLKTQTIEIDVQGNIYLNARQVTSEGLKSSLEAVPERRPSLSGRTGISACRPSSMSSISRRTWSLNG